MQRVSLPLPKPPTAYTASGMYALSLCLAKYMLDSGATETPMMFLNQQEVRSNVLAAYEFANKLNKDPLDSIPKSLSYWDTLMQKDEPSRNAAECISNLTVWAIQEPVACVLCTNENTLVVAGYNETFYIIDPAHNFFYATSSPEYEVKDYLKHYGSSDDIYMECYSLLRNKAEEEAPPPVEKKKKTSKKSDK